MKNGPGNAPRRRQSDVRGHGLAIAGDGPAALTAETRDGRTGVYGKVSDKHATERIVSGAVACGGLEAAKDAAAAQGDGGIGYGITRTVTYDTRNSAFPQEVDLGDYDLAGRRQSPGRASMVARAIAG